MSKTENNNDMRTREEVEKLKSQWMKDPIWDIEETEGFEEYYDELLSFRNEMEEKWESNYYKRRLEKSRKYGIEGNYALLDFLEHLEIRISELEKK